MSALTKIERHFGEIKKSSFTALATKWEAEKSWKERAQDIALELLDFLDEKDLTQKALAEMMGVSPQLVNKWLKGQENFTLETIGKMEAVLNRNLIQVITTPDKSNFMERTEPATFIAEYQHERLGQFNLSTKKAKVIPIKENYHSHANGY